MMPGRLIREESGMTMALALMVMVLVGVMGAGLLVFVQNDLRSVVESNQGQKAFNLADAGAQAGKAHLMTDADAIHYDGATDLAASPPNTESPWSYAGVGKTFNLDGIAGNSTTVKIQYLPPCTFPCDPEDPDYAPKPLPDGETNYPPGEDYFKVVSEGRAGDARRKVEAIYNTFSLDLPKGYYTPGNITISGSADITNISMFARGDVTVNGGASIEGKDLAYKKWAATGDAADASGYTPSYPNSYNSTPRLTDAAGIGAVGNINSEVAGRDYDGPIGEAAPRFVLAHSNPQLSSEISFPFASSAQPEMEEMRAAAQAQGNYYTPSGSTGLESGAELGVAASTPKWPTNSSTSTMVYVRFTNPAGNNNLTWDVDGSGDCNGTPARGTLVVENGNFKTGQNKLPLRGVVIVRHLGPGNEVYTDTGGACMESFVNASGDIKIAGSVEPATQERGNRPGFYGMRLWSWRECYSTTCS